MSERSHDDKLRFPFISEDTDPNPIENICQCHLVIKINVMADTIVGVIDGHSRDLPGIHPNLSASDLSIP